MSYSKEWQKAYYQKNKERIKKKSSDWRAKNPDKVKLNNKSSDPVKRKASTKRYRDKLKSTVLQAYGGKCECCGENASQFMALDHVNGDGNKMRKEKTHPIGGNPLYVWIIKKGFPKIFRLLCHNCNFAITHGRTCPHKSDVYSRFQTASVFNVFNLLGGT